MKTPDTTSPLRIRLQPLDAVLGDLPGNAARILDAARKAAADGISVLVLPADALSPAPSSPLLAPSPVAKRLAARAAEALPGLLAALPPSLALAGLHDLPSPFPPALALDTATVPFQVAGEFPAPPPPDAPSALRLNLHGAFDSLVCDGSAAAFAPGGTLLAANRPFTGAPLDLLLDGTTLRPLAPPAPAPSPAALLWDALVLSIRGYADKNRFPSAFVSLSGGIDSALVAALAVDALGPARVAAATFPSSVTSSETLADALELARRLGIPCPVVPIAPAFDLLSSLLPPPSAYPASPVLPGTLVEENLQSRIRGLLVMALSNRHGHLVLATGNRSEASTGYCTLYGDTCGGFAPLRDVLKTEVFALAAYRNALTPDAPPIPQSTIDRPPTAELRPGQRDSDSLPPYPALDALLGQSLPPSAAAEKCGLPPETARRVSTLLARSEYKRRQTPPGPSFRPPFPLPVTPLPL